MTHANLIVHNAKVTTLSPERPQAAAFAVGGESIVAVGDDAEILRHRGERTLVIDACGRRVIPGLNDSHIHAVRGGVLYHLELRWDGVDSLARGLEMIREQAKRTPKDQWVRVMGGWSPYQFRERRMPSVAELNAAAPDTPVLVLFAYSEVFLNRAGVAALQLTSASPSAQVGRVDFVDGGAIVSGGSPAVYAAIGSLPTLADPADKLNSTRYFLRELSRFGLTSVVDVGATGIAYPNDYAPLTTLASRPKFPVRFSNFVFAHKRGAEVDSFAKWTRQEQLDVNLAASRLNGFTLQGAGEILAWDAADYENFMYDRPELNEQTIAELAEVTRVIAKGRWPMRVHATYDESISHILDVFERIFEETNYTGRWAIDHAETISPKNIARVKAMNGGIAVQDRMAFAGEFFAERYGTAAAAAAQPLRQIIAAGISVGAGTDATRVASYNPWPSLFWMVTGRTVGGTQILSPDNLVSREEALRLYTCGSAWFSGEESIKGRISPGQYADFTVLSADYLSVPEERIPRIESVLTVTGGDIVYAASPFEALGPEALPAVTPGWSPVARFGGYQQAAGESVGA
jgi:predicted amidohydrolase YtcJ